MNIMQEKVAEFHKLFRLPIETKPGMPIKDRRELRAKLIEEECKETCTALRENDLIESADGLADLLYVTFGAALELGIDLQKVFDEVHRSNMSKAWTENEIHEMQRGWTKEGIYAVKNELGKVIKSPSYSKADIAKALEAT